MKPRFIRLEGYREYSVAEMSARARDFAAELGRRRSVRDFSDRPVPRALIEDCLQAAGSAPSGANQQPWHFVAISDPVVKHRIRDAAETEEREFYEHRAPPEWLEVLQPLGTDASKPFLDIAPWLVAVFIRRFERRPDGSKRKHYYTDESVGVATRLLLAAVHHAGLVALTHTPSPMKFLNDILDRPRDLERPFLLLVVGYPASDAMVPDIARRPLSEFTTFR